VADKLLNGHRIRALTVVDNFTRQCLAITVDHELTGSDVVMTMEHLHFNPVGGLWTPENYVYNRQTRIPSDSSTWG